jgi:hypothetical protein
MPTSTSPFPFIIFQLLRTALLLDIGMPVPAFLPHSYVPDTVPLEVRGACESL